MPAFRIRIELPTGAQFTITRDATNPKEARAVATDTLELHPGSRIVLVKPLDNANRIN